MNDNETSGKEASESVDEQRAQWEYFHFVVCKNGVVNVQNLSYGEEEAGNHIYSVMSAGGLPVRCSCPHHRKRGARCKHMVAVERNPLVASAANAAAEGSSQPVAADGGEPVADGDGDDEVGDDGPETDHWGNEVQHFDDGPCGAGEKCECQSCGERFEIALIAATADSSNRNWEEFYECQQCGATGTFRFIADLDRRMWTGRMDYPMIRSESPDMGGGDSIGVQEL